MDQYPNNEETEDMIIDDKIECHRMIVFKDNNRGVDD